MRLFSKIFSIIFVLYVLSILFVPSVKASCSIDSYQRCTGYCSSCSSTYYCGPDTTGYGCVEHCCTGTCRSSSCTSNETAKDYCDSAHTLVCCYPKPTNTPQPTATPKPFASPTATPTPATCTCINSTGGCNGIQCIYNFIGCATADKPTVTPACNSPNNARFKTSCGSTPCGSTNSSVCGYNAQCSTTQQDCSLQNPKCEKRDVSLDCNYDAYGCNLCGVGRVAAIYCDFDGDGIKENHCGDLCVSNSLCSNNQWCSGGGGTNPTNTPTPTRAPTSTNTPTPTATPTPNPHWLKLKNTSFYTSRSLAQSIPASPVAVTTQPCHCEPPQAAKQSHVPQKQQEHSCDSRGDCFGGVSP